MIKFEHINIYGWEPAIRGMRNPMNSWEKSDSFFGDFTDDATGAIYYDIGSNDLALMIKLAKAGSEHSKYRRFIIVTMDITAPLYWWKEFDTYKVGTVANSCSTMHKIHAKEFELDDFSHEHLKNYPLVENLDCMKLLIGILNENRKNFVTTKDKQYWWQMIQLLPSSYNQKRTVMLNYENLAHIYRQRKDHKLDEWRYFCKWIEELPYSEIITLEEDAKDDQA